MKKTMMIFTFLFTVMSLVITVYSVFSSFHQKNNNDIRLIFLKNKHFIAVLYIIFVILPRQSYLSDISLTGCLANCHYEVIIESFHVFYY